MLLNRLQLWRDSCPPSRGMSHNSLADGLYKKTSDFELFTEDIEKIIYHLCFSGFIFMLIPDSACNTTRVQLYVTWYVLYIHDEDSVWVVQYPLYYYKNSVLCSCTCQAAASCWWRPCCLRTDEGLWWRSSSPSTCWCRRRAGSGRCPSTPRCSTRPGSTTSRSAGQASPTTPSWPSDELRLSGLSAEASSDPWEGSESWRCKEDL